MGTSNTHESAITHQELSDEPFVEIQINPTMVAVHAGATTQLCEPKDEIRLRPSIGESFII